MKLLLTLFILLLGCGEHYLDHIVEDGDTHNTAPRPKSVDEIEDQYDPATNINLNIPVPEDLSEDFINYSETCDAADGEKEFRYYKDKIQELGGKSINPFIDLEYSEDLNGFDKFLDDSGIRNFSAAEIANSGRDSILKKCNLVNLLPPKRCWIR